MAELSYLEKRERSQTEKNDSEVVISVKNVSKKFCRNLRRSMFYGILDLSKNLVGIKPDTTSLGKDEFWAIKDVSFELKRGEVLGIIGPNGCGKSTLLRLLTGIFPPDKGEISVKGRLSALIAVGAGFHPHMTGRENLYLNGTILGMCRKEIDSKFQEIVDFADIGDFLEAPVSTYSSGMRVRLGFAIAVNVKPDILLVDEVLAVGDMMFRNKCFKKVDELRKGVSTVLVSHNLNYISHICDKAMMLQNGQVKYYGCDSSEVISCYNKAVLPQLAMSSVIAHHPGTEEYLRLRNVKMLDVDGNLEDNVVCGQPLRFIIELEVRQFLQKPIFNFILQSTQTTIGIAFIHQNANGQRPSFDVGVHKLEIFIDSFSLQPGNYTMRTIIHTDKFNEIYGKAYNLININVIPYNGQFVTNDTIGFVELKCEWKTELV